MSRRFFPVTAPKFSRTPEAAGTISTSSKADAQPARRARTPSPPRAAAPSSSAGARPAASPSPSPPRRGASSAYLNHRLGLFTLRAAAGQRTRLPPAARPATHGAPPAAPPLQRGPRALPAAALPPLSLPAAPFVGGLPSRPHRAPSGAGTTNQRAGAESSRLQLGKLGLPCPGGRVFGSRSRVDAVTAKPVTRTTLRPAGRAPAAQRDSELPAACRCGERVAPEGDREDCKKCETITKSLNIF